MGREKLTHDIVIIGQQPWDTEIGSNCKNIALEFSKTYRVLYINSPLDRITLLRAKNDPKIRKRLNVIKKTENGLIPIQENLWNLYPDCMVESINWLSNHKVFNFFNRINNKKFAKSINKALYQLKFKNIILFNDNEMFKGFYLRDFLKPDLSIYYSRDYMLGVDYWKKHGQLFEPKLIKKSDLCFANSTYLSDYCKQYNPQSFYVGQGCDVDKFKAKNEVAKSHDAKKTTEEIIIGYVGSLDSNRLDINVIEHIALNFPEYRILLVGPEDHVFKSSALHTIKNVSFLGQKNPDELPGYVNAFDVCINPQIVNEITIGNYPRKIDEYLAAGKPVVVTATKTMEAFKDFVYLADKKEDYVKLIQKALLENSSELAEKRAFFASTHTWENSIKIMLEEISNSLSRK